MIFTVESAVIMRWCHIYYITSVILYIYSGYVTASKYYVSAAPNGDFCPSTDLPCHDLSYYTDDYTSYFTDDTIFVFLEGIHTLKVPLDINGVSNITLQGLGHIEHGFHETVMQSTSVIRCSYYNRSGIQFTSSSDVVLSSLTITNCGAFYNSTFRPANVSLLFVDSNNVTLEWVSVQNSSGIGLSLYNAFDVLITNSTFANNVRLKIFPANAVIFYDTQLKRQSRVNIMESNFTLTYGYGMAFFYNKNNNEVEINIENNKFLHNTGKYGGGVFIYLEEGRCSIKFIKCIIDNNTAQQYGGGVSIEFYKGGGIIEFSNCTIHNNTAPYGGGVYIYLYKGSGIIEFSNCTIYSNIAYYGSGLFIIPFEVTSTSGIQFCNVLLHFNKVPKKLNKYQSAVFVSDSNNVTFDQIEISNHDITGLLGVNSQIIFDGHNMFVNNSGIYGGGIALYESSKLLLNQFTNISFVNNHASELGGGIFVSQFFNISINTDCSFKVIPYHHFDDNKTVLYFVSNTADISGDVLFGGKFSHCFTTLYFDHLFYYPQQRSPSVVSSDPIKVCFCESNMQNCSIKIFNITAMPGINVNISLATVGNKDGLTNGVVKLTTSDNSSSTVQTDNTRLNATCTNVTFKITANPSLNTTQVYVTLESSISEPSSDPLAKVIEVNIESCPIGFPLERGTCVCRSELNLPSITCDIQSQIITRDGDMWIGYKNDSDCLIVYQNCPFDYCNDGTVLFKIASPDLQCLLNRSGLLCGQCSEGLSLMLGSNYCGQCTNNYIAFIIPFALAGIALVAFVIALNLTVSVGTINGLIFYANVVKIYEPIFFPNGPVKVLSQFISWLNLDLGIETCFFDGMDSCSKTWLQFIFPGYVWFLLILIIISSQYSSKVVRLVGSHAVPVLATMILLSYAKLIRTVFQALYFTNIQCSGGDDMTLLRWYIDANVQYAGGYCHLPLFLFSLVVLILFIIPYTFYLLTIPLFEGPLSKYMCCCQKYMKPFFDAYGGPYKDKCRFWTGFLLLIRVVLALVVSLDTEAMSWQICS